MSLELYPHQKKLVEKIEYSTSKRNCIQAATGFGKTAIFSNIAENYKGKVLILVNRTELIDQTAEHLSKNEVFKLTAKEKKKTDKRITIAMVETFSRRQKKGIYDANEFDLIIADEVHNLQFVKCFEGFNNRLLGFTATPITDNKEYYFKCKTCNSKYDKKEICCNKETHEYSKNVSLKKWYGDLITSEPIEWLIDNGYLVDVQNYICDVENLDKLKVDKSGQFTSESEKEVFENRTAINNLIANYKTHCKGLKTMIFNSNIRANKTAFAAFEALGYNVKYYDSVTDQNRKEVVNWFRSTPDAILMSVGVFTTGFDVKEVEAIILNRATQSRALYYQMVGRGGRITDKIFKTYFKLIDLGGNVSRFGSWSAYVDWEELYYNDKEKKRRYNVLEDYKTCHNCGAMIKEYACDYCGAEEKKKKVKISGKIEIAEKIESLKPPKKEHIINYALANDLDVNGAKNLTANYLLDMVVSKNYPKETYRKNMYNIRARTREIITPIYFEINRSKLKGNRVRTLRDFENKVMDRLEKHYETRK